MPDPDWADDTAAEIIVIAYTDPDARNNIAQALRAAMLLGAQLQQEMTAEREAAQS
jgi:hypothetical protein